MADATNLTLAPDLDVGEETPLYCSHQEFRHKLRRCLAEIASSIDKTKEQVTDLSDGI